MACRMSRQRLALAAKNSININHYATWYHTAIKLTLTQLVYGTAQKPVLEAESAVQFVFERL